MPGRSTITSDGGRWRSSEGGGRWLTGVTVVEATTDPLGRPATRVDFVDDRHRPGLVNSIFLDPDTTQLLAQLKTENGRPIYTCRFTERRLVGQLPDDIVAALGSERIEKIVHP